MGRKFQGEPRSFSAWWLVLVLLPIAIATWRYYPDGAAHFLKDWSVAPKYR